MGHVKPLPLPFCGDHDDAFIPAFLRPAFSAFEPCFLEDTIEKRDRDMIIRGVSVDMLFNWKTLHPEVRETSPLRYKYDSSTSRFIVKCATSPVHNFLHPPGVTSPRVASQRRSVHGHSPSFVWRMYVLFLPSGVFITYKIARSTLPRL